MNEQVPPGEKSMIAGASPRRLRWTFLDWTLLIAVLGIALWIRLTHIDTGMSFDELWHLATTKGIGSAMSYYSHDIVHHDAMSLTSLEHKQNLWHIWSGMDGILHPPLFIVALRLWREVVGTSDLAAHGFSIFCGVLSIAFTYLAGRLAMGRVAGFLAVLAFACSQTQVYFSQEVRAYAMLIALGSAALWLMTTVEVLGPTKRRLVPLALLTLPLMLTHYFCVGGCLAIAIYGWIAAGRHRKAFVVSLLASAATYLVIWVPFAARQLDDLGTGDAFLKLNAGKAHVLLLAAGTPFRLLVERDYQLEMTPLLSAVVFVLPWMLIKRLRPLLPWSIWLAASVLPVLMLDLTRATVHTAYIRYLAIATPAVSLLFLGTVWAMGWRWMAYGFGVALSFAGAIYILSDTRVLLDADDLNDATRLVEPRFAKGDAIVTSSGMLPQFYCDALALTLSHSDKIFPTTLVIADHPLTPETVQQLGTRSIWLVSGDLSVPVEQFIPGGRVVYEGIPSRAVKVRHVVIDAPASSGEGAVTRPSN